MWQAPARTDHLPGGVTPWNLWPYTDDNRNTGRQGRVLTYNCTRFYEGDSNGTDQNSGGG